MAMITRYRIETKDGLFWVGGAFSHDELDALEFRSEAAAIEEAAELQDVFVERVERWSAFPDVTTSTAVTERTAA